MENKIIFGEKEVVFEKIKYIGNYLDIGKSCVFGLYINIEPPMIVGMKSSFYGKKTPIKQSRFLATFKTSEDRDSEIEKLRHFVGEPEEIF